MISEKLMIIINTCSLKNIFSVRYDFSTNFSVRLYLVMEIKLNPRRKQ